MPTLVIGDIHGNPDALRDILRRAEVLTVDGTRRPGWRVVSVGDLVNLAPPGSEYRGFVSDDAEVLRMMHALNYVDVVTVGNHEAAITHNIAASAWYGMAARRQLQPYVLETLAGLVRTGRYVAAATAHGYLVTHAGVDPRLQSSLSDDAYIATHQLNYRLVHTPHDPLITSIGPDAGGRDACGGVLWLRRSEQSDQPVAAKWPQIVGHTPDQRHPYYSATRDTWYVDSGGYLERPGKGAGIAWNETLNEWEVVD